MRSESVEANISGGTQNYANANSTLPRNQFIEDSTGNESGGSWPRPDSLKPRYIPTAMLPLSASSLNKGCDEEEQ